MVRFDPSSVVSPRSRARQAARAQTAILIEVKTNPLPWFPWWPKMEESHYLPIIALGLVLAAVLIYFAF